MAKDQRLVSRTILYLKENKKTIIAIVLLFSLVVYLGVPFWSPHPSPEYRSGTAYPDYAYESDGSVALPSVGRGMDEAAAGKTGNRYYEIKTGYANINSDSVADDVQKTKNKITELNGRVDSENRHETDTTVTITLVAKVPSQEFNVFALWLTEQFDVENSNFQYYTEDVGPIQNEIAILTESLLALEKMEKEVADRPVTSDSLNLLFDITQKKLELMRMLRQYGYAIEQVQERANESTVTLSYTEEKEDIPLLPENTKASFMAQLRNALRQLVQIGIEIITLPIVVLAQAVKFVVFAVIILAVVLVAYKLVRKAMPSVKTAL